MSSLHTGGATAATAAPEAGRSPAALARVLLPSMLGLALARTGLIVGSYGSYNQTDLGIYTDGPMLATLAVMGVLLIILAASKRQLRRRTVTLLAELCILVETMLLMAQAAITLDGEPHGDALFALSMLLSLFSSGAMFYWLRRAKGCSGALAAIYVFGALIVSEVFLEALSLMPQATALFVAAAGSFAQLACLFLAFHARPLRTLNAQEGPHTYFGYTRTPVDDKRFLVSTAIGIGLLAIVIGLLRGYPDGLPIAFSEGERLGYAGLTIVISAVIVYFMARGNRRTMTMGIWVVLELLACAALIAYAAFPQALGHGALFATTVNALMVGLVWYTVVAFESHGWRDPYYYALAGWIVWLGCRGVARTGLLVIYPFAANDLVVNAVMGLMLLVSTQVVFSCCLRDADSLRQLPAEAGAAPVAVGSGEGAPEAAATGPAGGGEAGDAPLDALHPAAGPSAEEIRASVLEAMARDDAPPSPFAAAEGAAAPASARPAATSPATAPTPMVAPAARQARPQFSRLMGLDVESAPVATRQPTLARGVEEMGRRFMLSEREIEVLTLYALGYTQKRVAEELFISPGTAHTHIKRIYAKTGMHSRQDILDYLEAYGS